MGSIKKHHFLDTLLSIKTLGLDTMCFLYQFADHPLYSPLTQTLFQLLEKNKVTAVTSMVTIAETFVLPERQSDTVTLLEYEEIFQQLPNFQLVPINWEVARLASKLRANYTFMKTPDAIQIGASLLMDCKGFLTNDEKLRKVKELKVIVLKDYV